MAPDLTWHHSHSSSHTVIHTTTRHYYHSGVTGYGHTTTYTHGGGPGSGWIALIAVIAVIALVVARVRRAR